MVCTATQKLHMIIKTVHAETWNGHNRPNPFKRG